MGTLNMSEKEDFSVENTQFLAIRENGDYEIIFFFNPSSCSVDVVHIKAILTRASLRTGVSGAELKNINFGEFRVHFNPVVSNEDDRKFVKGLFIDYFNDLQSSSV